MKKVIFFIESLQTGGAQKNLIYLANSLSKKKYKVFLVTYNHIPDEYKIENQVNRIKLDLSAPSKHFFSSFLNNLKRIKEFRFIIKSKNPDVIVSFIGTTNILISISAIFLKKKIIISERNDPEKQEIGKIWRFLSNFTYRMASIITINSRHGFDFLKKKLNRTNIYFVPNFVIPISSTNKKINLQNFILSIGRLTKQKGFDKLIKSFVEYKDSKKNNLKLVILGEGEDLFFLKKLIPRKYKNEILFLGKVDPFPYYKNCRIFVLASRFEGTPNVLFEAMSHGITIIVRKSGLGMDEYLKNMENAIIVDKNKDINSLSEAIDYCLSNPNLSRQMGLNAQKIIRLSNNQNILDKWMQLIN